MAHLGPLTRRFFKVLLASMVGVSLIGILLLALAGTPPPWPLLLLPIMVAAFDAGRELEQRAGRVSLADGARVAAVFLAVTVGLYLFVGLGALAGQGMLGILSGGSLVRLLGPFAFMVVLSFVLIRAMMWFGARTVRKAG
ncbi:MAG: ABZJ_00895 family protein [Pseudomonadota bacterium]